MSREKGDFVAALLAQDTDHDDDETTSRREDTTTSSSREGDEHHPLDVEGVHSTFTSVGGDHTETQGSSTHVSGDEYSTDYDGSSSYESGDYTTDLEGATTQDGTTFTDTETRYQYSEEEEYSVNSEESNSGFGWLDRTCGAWVDRPSACFELIAPSRNTSLLRESQQAPVSTRRMEQGGDGEEGTEDSVSNEDGGEKGVASPRQTLLEPTWKQRIAQSDASRKSIPRHPSRTRGRPQLQSPRKLPMDGAPLAGDNSIIANMSADVTSSYMGALDESPFVHEMIQHYPMPLSPSSANAVKTYNFHEELIVVNEPDVEEHTVGDYSARTSRSGLDPSPATQDNEAPRSPIRSIISPENATRRSPFKDRPSKHKPKVVDVIPEAPTQETSSQAAHESLPSEPSNDSTARSGGGLRVETNFVHDVAPQDESRVNHGEGISNQSSQPHSMRDRGQIMKNGSESEQLLAIADKLRREVSRQGSRGRSHSSNEEDDEKGRTTPSRSRSTKHRSNVTGRDPDGTSHRDLERSVFQKRADFVISSQLEAAVSPKSVETAPVPAMRLEHRQAAVGGNHGSTRSRSRSRSRSDHPRTSVFEFGTSTQRSRRALIEQPQERSSFHETREDEETTGRDTDVAEASSHAIRGLRMVERNEVEGSNDRLPLKTVTVSPRSNAVSPRSRKQQDISENVSPRTAVSPKSLENRERAPSDEREIGNSARDHGLKNSIDEEARRRSISLSVEVPTTTLDKASNDKKTKGSLSPHTPSEEVTHQRDLRSSKSRDEKSMQRRKLRSQEALDAAKELRKLEKRLEKQLNHMMKAKQENNEDDLNASKRELRSIEKQLERRLRKDDEKRASKLKRLRKKPEFARGDRTSNKLEPSGSTGNRSKEKATQKEIRPMRSSKPMEMYYSKASRNRKAGAEFIVSN